MDGRPQAVYCVAGVDKSKKSKAVIRARALGIGFRTAERATSGKDRARQKEQNEACRGRAIEAAKPPPPATTRVPWRLSARGCVPWRAHARGHQRLRLVPRTCRDVPGAWAKVLLTHRG